MANNDKKWECHICTFMNKSDKTKCSVCDGRKRARRFVNVNSEEENQNNSPKIPKLLPAADALTRQQAENAVKVVLRGHWKCNVCTFINTPDLYKCDVCGILKGTSTRGQKLNPRILEKQKFKSPKKFPTSVKIKTKPPPPPAKGKKEVKYQRKTKTFVEKENKKIYPKLDNIDRSLAVSYMLSVNNETIVITEFVQPKVFPMQ